MKRFYLVLSCFSMSCAFGQTPHEILSLIDLPQEIIEASKINPKAATEVVEKALATRKTSSLLRNIFKLGTIPSLLSLASLGILNEARKYNIKDEIKRIWYHLSLDDPDYAVAREEIIKLYRNPLHQKFAFLVGTENLTNADIQIIAQEAEGNVCIQSCLRAGAFLRTLKALQSLHYQKKITIPAVLEDSLAGLGRFDLKELRDSALGALLQPCMAVGAGALALGLEVWLILKEIRYQKSIKALMTRMRKEVMTHLSSSPNHDNSFLKNLALNTSPSDAEIVVGYILLNDKTLEKITYH